MQGQKLGLKEVRHAGVVFVQGESDAAIWVYVSTPLGCGLAQLTEAAMLRGSPVRTIIADLGSISALGN